MEKVISSNKADEAVINDNDDNNNKANCLLKLAVAPSGGRVGR